MKHSITGRFENNKLENGGMNERTGLTKHSMTGVFENNELENGSRIATDVVRTFSKIIAQ